MSESKFFDVRTIMGIRGNHKILEEQYEAMDRFKGCGTPNRPQPPEPIKVTNIDEYWVAGSPHFPNRVTFTYPWDEFELGEARDFVSAIVKNPDIRQIIRQSSYYAGRKHGYKFSSVMTKNKGGSLRIQRIQ